MKLSILGLLLLTVLMAPFILFLRLYLEHKFGIKADEQWMCAGMTLLSVIITMGIIVATLISVGWLRSLFPTSKKPSD